MQIRFVLHVSFFVGLALILPAGAPAFAQDSNTYSVEGYQALEQSMEEADLERLSTEPGSEERREATEDAIAARRELLRYLSGWINSGEMDDGMATYARDARLIVVENIVQLSVDLGYCEDARQSLALISEFSASDRPEQQRAYETARDRVDSCEPVVSQATADETTDDTSDSNQSDAWADDDVADGTPDDAADVSAPVSPTPEPHSRTLAWTLTGVGGALIVGGGLWNFMLLDDRNEYVNDRDLCESTGERCGAADNGRETLRGAQVPIGVMVGGGAVLAIVGTTLLLLPERVETPPSSVRLNLELDGDYAGIRIQGVWR